MMRFHILASLLCAATPIIAADFQKSCSDIKALDQYLSATCKTSSGSELCTEVDLSACIKNYYGRLVFINDIPSDQGVPYFDPRQDPSATRDSCQNCSTVTPFMGLSYSYLLHCDSCPNGRDTVGAVGSYDLSQLPLPPLNSQQWWFAYVDKGLLGTIIDNQDGYLMCFRERGAIKDASYCRDRNIDKYRH